MASRGGNFLLNVGPTPDGAIQPEFSDRLKGIGKWMDRNSESIYGTTYGPIQGVSAVRTTANGSDVFIHIFDWPGTTLQLSAENLPPFRSAGLLASGEPIAFHQESRRVVLTLPPQAPDPDVTVIVMKGA